jgi:glycosyltransferase involved in cell wall biosynthesis
MILGDGDTESYRKKADEMGIPSKIIEFGGPLSTEEVAVRMHEADCFVLFSNYENLPCVMIEAMATGLPVIATDVGGVREHLKPELGVLIKAGQIDELVKAMEFVMKNYQRYNSQSISLYAQRFGYEEVGKRFDEVYKEVAGR